MAENAKYAFKRYNIMNNDDECSQTREPRWPSAAHLNHSNPKSSMDMYENFNFFKTSISELRQIHQFSKWLQTI